MLPTSSPGVISYSPATTTPPFAVGVVFSYVCNDPTRYRVEPTSATTTTCEVGDQFTHDLNPPTCVEACKLCLLFVASSKNVLSIPVFVYLLLSAPAINVFLKQFRFLQSLASYIIA